MENREFRMLNPEQEEFKKLGLKVAPDMKDRYNNKEIYDFEEASECYMNGLTCCGGIQAVICLPCAPCGCGPLRQIRQGEVGLLLQNGKLIRKYGPGLHTLNTCVDRLIVVNMKTNIHKLPPLDLITKDNITVKFDCFVTFNISIPEYAIFRVDSVTNLIQSLVMGALKTLVATKRLDQLLAQREQMEEFLTKDIDEQTDYFGINVSSIETVSIDLPQELEQALVASAFAERESISKVISAQANLETAKIYRDSAIELSKNKVSLQLQYFELLKKITKEKPTKLILPFFLNE